jgi:hypothetical protein
MTRSSLLKRDELTGTASTASKSPNQGTLDI